MKDYISEFRTYLVDVKKCSDNTFDAYMRDISQFITYCNMNGTSDLKDVDRTFIDKYLEYLDFLGKSASTKSRLIASVRCYFKFLISFGIADCNPADGIKFKKSNSKIPGILDSKDILLLLSQPKGDDYKSIRDRAILELLYATGIKVSELVSISVSDLNLQLGLLHLHIDDKHERMVPVYPAAVKHISEYVTNVRPALVQSETGDILFTNMNGTPLSRQGLWKMIKHYADQAGIKSEITPHTLRHSFAAHLLENGADLKDIKDMLGHADISSTQVYAQFVKNKYTLAYKKFHPLAK